MADQAAHLEIARTMWRFRDTMWRFRADGFLCDTVLYTDDSQQIKAHSVVLAAASPILRDSLGVDNAERAKPYMIQLPGCDITTLEIALRVIYTGSLENREGTSAEMLQKVFLLLQQLGVELDRIDGCSVTHIDRH